MIVRKALPTDPKHLQIAFSDLGLKEIKGRKSNPRVVEMFKHSGFPGVKSDETAWCAAAVGSWLKEAGLSNSKSLAARSYMEWGSPTSKPKRGDVVVFKRGTGWQGHVGLYLGEQGGRIYHIGGNQSNSVSIASTPKSKLVGYRVPGKLRSNRTLQGATTASAGGAVSLFGEQAQGEHASGFQQQLHDMGMTFVDLGTMSRILLVVGVLLMVGGFGWAVYNAWKGR